MKRIRPFFRAFGALHRTLHWTDLAVLLSAPVYGVTIRYLLPILSKLVLFMPDLRPWQRALDSLLMLVSAFSILYPFVLCGVEERMNGIALSLTVSPLRSGGYFLCRYITPCLYAAVYAFLMELCFCPATLEREISHTILCCLLAAPAALSGMLIAPVLTRDKLNGVTLLQLSVILFMALPAVLGNMLPMFLQPLFILCPAYWLRRYALNRDWLMAVMCLITCGLWLLGGYALWSRSLKHMRLMESVE